MQITMNEKAIEVFSGARVEDVLRKYSRAEWDRVRRKEKMVIDRHGHEVGLDGELMGGEILRTAPRPPEEFRP